MDALNQLLGSGLSQVLALVLPAAVLALTLTLAVWLYRDGNRRGRLGRLMLGLVVLTGPLAPLALLSWIAFRPPPTAEN